MDNDHLFFFSSFSYTKAQTFADCVGHELPYGWEECYDGQIGIYYIDHINSEDSFALTCYVAFLPFYTFSCPCFQGISE